MDASNETAPPTGYEKMPRAITARRTGHTASDAQLAVSPKSAQGLPPDLARSSSA